MRAEARERRAPEIGPTPMLDLHIAPTAGLASRLSISQNQCMSTSILDDEEALFEVVVNHEEQYSIWPADREPPVGWRKVGTSGKKADCLARINQVWTDMRPLSLRRRTAGQA